MEVRLHYTSGAQFVGETGSGHSLVVDGPESIGGRNTGPRPMELMLLSVGSCSSVDVLHILRKARQQVTGCEVRVSGVRAETDPKVFTDIALHFTVRGRGLKAAQVERAVALSAEKYCSASIMLGASARITHTVDIVEEGESRDAAQAGS